MLPHDHVVILAARDPSTGWTRPLAEVLRSLPGQPVHLVAIESTSAGAQVLITLEGGGATVEVSGPVAIAGADRLAAVGFTADQGRWSLVEPVGDGQQLAELVAHVLVTLAGGDGRAPLRLQVLGDARECAACVAA